MMSLSRWPQKFRIQWPLLCTLLIVADIPDITHAESNLSGPRFFKEPSGLIEFSNSTGFRVECSANGNPQPRITWTFADGSAVTNIPGLRQVETDGTLVFFPFRAEDYRQDVHSVVYRCLAFSSLGSIISRDIQVKAVVAQTYEVYVYDTYVIKGNVAIFKCHVPGFLVEYVKVLSWMKDSTLIEDENFLTDGKYVMTTSGDLYIRNANSEDAKWDYRCKTIHRLTNITRVSGKAGKLFVTEPEANIPPRIFDSKSEIVVMKGDPVSIPCITQGFPVPTVEWFLTTSRPEELKPIEINDRFHRNQDSLIILEARKSDEGNYICVSTNLVGNQRQEIRLTVNEPLQVSVTPPVIQLEDNRIISFTCEVKGHPVSSITWIKDAKEATAVKDIEIDGLNLLIRNAKSIHKGMYQCVAKNAFGTAHGTAEVQLGVSSPEFVSVFDSKLLQPGTSISLQCAAIGNPKPGIHWFLDNQNITEEAVSLNLEGVVTSWLNISLIRSEQGGMYGCVAENKAGKRQHYRKINVYGSLKTRQQQKVSTVAGKEVQLICPIYGYPIESIRWEKDDEELPANMRQRIIDNGILSIENTRRSGDSGEYKCTAKNSRKEVITASVKVSVLVPPKITPFSFQEDLVREGMRARIQCVISEGDLPLTIEWKKDGQSIPSDLGIVIRDLDEFSSVLMISSVTPKHNGNYMCFASNEAATVSHTAVLSVNVPPKVIPFSFQDDQFFKGMRAHIICAASQGDLPINFQWLKDGQEIPPSLRVITRNIDGHANSLSIESVSSVHTGNYTCIASNDAATVSYTTPLLVYVSPKIIPFAFQDHTTHLGALARVSCVVYQGDLPLRIEWLKDGESIPKELGVFTRTIDEYSSILTIEKIETRHRGNYTCTASNAAATISHTAEMTVNVPPKIVPFTFQDDSLEGTLVRVSCIVSRGDLPLSITWLKDGKDASRQSNIKVKDFDEFSSVLSIDPVKSENKGSYTCVATNHAGNDSHTAQLTVNVPPIWIVKPHDIISQKDKSVMFNCQAGGYPKPVIRWMKALENNPSAERQPIDVSDGTELLSNGSLYFPKAYLNHQGYYFCYASNGIGHDLSKVISLKIQAPVYFKEKHLNYTVNSGTTVTLKCEAFGDQPITFSWTWNQISIEDLPLKNRFTQEITNNTEQASIVGLLHLNDARISDMGRYSCLAQNIHGGETLDIDLNIQERPSIPLVQTVINKGNRSVEISWIQASDGNSPIIHFIVQYKRKQDSWQSRATTVTFDGSVLSATIQGLHAATIYEFRVAAENTVGRSAFSNILTIVTGEEAPDGAPQQVEVEVTDPQSIRVSWKAPLKTKWNGVIRGYYVGYKMHDSAESYTFTKLEVPDDYGEDLIYQLTNLKMFTQYSIIVQAYNNGGRGPHSEEIVIMTSEDVPSEPPSAIRCSSLSSKSIYVIWEPPSPASVNGILRGYKVFYKPLTDYLETSSFAEETILSRITLQSLEVDTNYSIQISAFTKMGDGVKSDPIFCKTYEDVPESPESIKVLPSSSDSVIVAWKAPKKPNGIITKYNVYYRPIGKGEEYNKDTRNENGKGSMNMHSLTPEFDYFEVKGLQPNSQYAFWVTATSSIGEGPESKVLTESPAGKIVPARSVSFHNIIKTPWKRDVVMPCVAVGIPQPQKHWMTRGRTIAQTERVLIRFDGSLLLKRADSEDTGNYTCKIKNQYGTDEVHYTVNVIVPPGSPKLDILSKSLNSIRFRWRSGSTGGEAIKGYIIHYKRDSGQWEKKELPGDIDLYTLENLACGATYQLYMEAFNSIGTGSPCEIVTVTTNGDAFTMPSKNVLIKEGSTFATINLDSWPSNGCPILYFVIEYKLQSDEKWTSFSDRIKPVQKKLVLPGLLPASWYVLRITAYTSGDDFNIAEYIFSTLTTLGGNILHDDSYKEEKVIMFSLDPYIFIPVVTTLIIIIIVSVTIFVVCKKNQNRRKREAMIDWTRAGTLSRYRNELGESVESFVQLQKMGGNAMTRNTVMRRGPHDADPTYATIRSTYQTLKRGRCSDPLPPNHQVTHLSNMNTAWVPAGPAGAPNQFVQVPVSLMQQNANFDNVRIPTKEPIYGHGINIGDQSVIQQNHPSLISAKDVKETTFIEPQANVALMGAPDDSCPGSFSTLEKKDSEGQDEGTSLLAKP